jgi:ligand-binding SRPBCC domain-containing protein
MSGLYTLETTQFIPISVAEAWDFFSTPDNLQFLTPKYLKFVIISRSGTHKIYPGQIICYQLRPLLGIPVSWVTEITHMDVRHFFIDEQRFGPYTFWHHAHFFREVPGGVEMRDLVHYKIPFGFLGRWAHTLFVRRQLEGIFSFRKKYLEKKYPHAVKISVP